MKAPLAAHLLARGKKLAGNTKPFQTGFKAGTVAPFNWLLGRKKKVEALATKARQSKLLGDERSRSLLKESATRLVKNSKSQAMARLAVAKVVALKVAAVKVSVVTLPAAITAWLGYATYRGVKQRKGASQLLAVQKKHLGRLVGWAAVEDSEMESSLRQHHVLGIRKDGRFVFDPHQKEAVETIPCETILGWVDFYRKSSPSAIQIELIKMREEIQQTNP